MNVDILEQIEGDSSRLVKESLLPKLDKDLQHFVKLALDPDVTFGVTVGDDELVAESWQIANQGGNAGRAMAEQPWTEWFKRSLDKLAKRETTGGSASSLVIEIVQRAPSALHAKWAGRIINRNLRAGFDIRTYNIVFGTGAVKKFEVQLADTYEGQELRGLWYFQPKLDGNRVVFIDRRAMSRSGKIYQNCEYIIEEILSKDPDFFEKWVIDGEMMGDLGFDQSSGALRRLDQKGRKKANFTYWAFDLIDRNEWESRKTRTLFNRELDLRRVVEELGLITIKLVPTTKLHNPTHDQVMEMCRENVAHGFEGLMAKAAETPYIFKRADNLLKVKLFHDADMRLDSVYEGKGRNKGRLGGINISGIIDGKLYTARCGSGFSDPLREEIWANPDAWKGAIVQVQYFEATKDLSLRFPVFIMRRKDKEGAVPLPTPDVGHLRFRSRIPVPVGQHTPDGGVMTFGELDALIDEIEKEYEAFLKNEQE